METNTHLFSYYCIDGTNGISTLTEKKLKRQCIFYAEILKVNILFCSKQAEIS